MKHTISPHLTVSIQHETVLCARTPGVIVTVCGEAVIGGLGMYAIMGRSCQHMKDSNNGRRAESSRAFKTLNTATMVGPSPASSVKALPVVVASIPRVGGGIDDRPWASAAHDRNGETHITRRTPGRGPFDRARRSSSTRSESGTARMRTRFCMRYCPAL
jgi:hypothetical protein